MEFSVHVIRFLFASPIFGGMSVEQAGIIGMKIRNNQGQNQKKQQALDGVMKIRRVCA